jgi:hypothetical protein
MKLSIDVAENGFVIGVHDNDYHCFFVAVSVEETAEIIRDILSDETEGKLDLSHLAFNPVANDK